MGKAKIFVGQRFGKLAVVRPTEKRSGRSLIWECLCDCGNTDFVPSYGLLNGWTNSCGCCNDYYDLSGQRFGNLVTIQPTEKFSGSSIVWECLCDCGNTAFVSLTNLKSGHTKSCGCIRRTINLKDQRFGKLVALHPTEMRTHGSIVWECRCDCGNITFASVADLKSGRTKSCGCNNRQNTLTGQRFGKLVALRPTEKRSHGSILWECQCDCGNTVFLPLFNLKSGNTKSCGCLKRKKQ